jgi:putative transposase
MKENPDLRHRRSLRLKDYDYSQDRMYFITISTQNHQWLFGKIREETMHLNDAGKMIEKWYWELSNKFPDIQCDEYIIMPNHIHFIIHKIDTTTIRTGIRADTVGADLCVRPKVNKNSSVEQKKGEHTGSPLRKIKKNDEQIMEIEKIDESTMRSSIPKIVQWFKTMTTNEYIRRIKKDGWKPFHGKLWQRNYYEHIIRNEIELKQIREYIMNNPLKWKFDKEYL